MIIADPWLGLPDSAREPEFYEGVVTKRFFAWVVDVALIWLLTLILVPLTAFTAVFYLPFLYLLVSFLYRWVALSRSSATPGMRIAAIEFRRGDGERLDTGTALLHVSGYAISLAMFPVQLVSIALMLVTPRKQGLHDLVLGTAAVRRMVSH